MAQLTDLHQSKRGISAAIACLVQTIGETDPTFQQRFMARLEAAYSEIREQPTGTPPAVSANTSEALESLTWIRELLTGWSFSEGQGKPFLASYDRS